ncbi:unnamed protein product [Clonostachys solani]|uniref:Ysc84 actin-binding domain-containing protein n=1 Tax=Clonostachys solani TaxID=160281 RepID=A0A9N9W5A7_9HYPO|nr:unnamed protein product [Clonostachys solani]
MAQVSSGRFEAMPQYRQSQRHVSFAQDPAPVAQMTRSVSPIQQQTSRLRAFGHSSLMPTGSSKTKPTTTRPETSFPFKMPTGWGSKSKAAETAVEGPPLRPSYPPSGRTSTNPRPYDIQQGPVVAMSNERQESVNNRIRSQQNSAVSIPQDSRRQNSIGATPGPLEPTTRQPTVSFAPDRRRQQSTFSLNPHLGRQTSFAAMNPQFIRQTTMPMSMPSRKAAQNPPSPKKVVKESRPESITPELENYKLYDNKWDLTSPTYNSITTRASTGILGSTARRTSEVRKRATTAANARIPQQQEEEDPIVPAPLRTNSIRKTRIASRQTGFYGAPEQPMPSPRLNNFEDSDSDSLGEDADFTPAVYSKRASGIKVIRPRKNTLSGRVKPPQPLQPKPRSFHPSRVDTLNSIAEATSALEEFEFDPEPVMHRDGSISITLDDELEEELRLVRTPSLQSQNDWRQRRNSDASEDPSTFSMPSTPSDHGDHATFPDNYGPDSRSSSPLSFQAEEGLEPVVVDMDHLSPVTPLMLVTPRPFGAGVVGPEVQEVEDFMAQKSPDMEPTLPTPRPLMAPRGSRTSKTEKRMPIFFEQSSIDTLRRSIEQRSFGRPTGRPNRGRSPHDEDELFLEEVTPDNKVRIGSQHPVPVEDQYYSRMYGTSEPSSCFDSDSDSEVEVGFEEGSICSGSEASELDYSTFDFPWMDTPTAHVEEERGRPLVSRKPVPPSVEQRMVNDAMSVRSMQSMQSMQSECSYAGTPTGTGENAGRFPIDRLDHSVQAPDFDNSLMVNGHVNPLSAHSIRFNEGDAPKVNKKAISPINTQNLAHLQNDVPHSAPVHSSPRAPTPSDAHLEALFRSTTPTIISPNVIEGPSLNLKQRTRPSARWTSRFTHFGQKNLTRKAKQVTPPTDTLEIECFKGAKLLQGFCNQGVVPQGAEKLPTELMAERMINIPQEVIRGAIGLIIFNTFRGGISLAGGSGTGLIVARLPDGSWSPPSAIHVAHFGGGLSASVDMLDSICVINSEEALAEFMGMRVVLGYNVPIKDGPWGRGETIDPRLARSHRRNESMESDDSMGYTPSFELNNGRMTLKLHEAPETAPMYIYVASKGQCVSCSYEGSVFTERKDVNHRYYGEVMSAEGILRGYVEVPEGCEAIAALQSALCAAEYEPMVPEPMEQRYPRSPARMTMSFPDDN